jgi:2-polyprenyl-6-methoxyphenol hydroxylase-like FAD-dependent oxidoreductase
MEGEWKGGSRQETPVAVSRIVTASGAREELRSRFLVGCDGAHSTVRKKIRLTFQGGAFPEECNGREGL